MKSILLTIASFLAIGNSINAQDDYFREKGVADLYPFYHGVASGDPMDDRVMLWTRVTDDTLTVDSVMVEWRIATDTSMNNIVTSGTGYAAANRDWTFKVDAAGLQPAEWYYYDFKALGYYSLRGRTKTLPVGDIDSLRFGMVTCSNWEHGYFSAYRHLAERNDVDYVLHLGDYIYEYEVGGFSGNISGRENEPTHEIITLEDYRIRHSHYKLDADLRRLHQQYPFINIWDDHETANDSYKDGAANHTPGTEGLWSDRKENSAQAYFEWLPIRPPVPGTSRIYRDFQFGDLINMPMLDTRIEARDEQGGSAETNDPNRTMMGVTQFDWLTNNLKNSTKRWNIVGQQVMIAPLEFFGTPLNWDQWDGYNYERTRLLDTITANNINNFVVLTGDIHTSWVNDIPMSNYSNSGCTGSAGVEFVVTSVTSTSFISFNMSQTLLSLANPHNIYANTSKRGYAILDVNKMRTQFDYFYMDDVEDPASGQYFADAYYVNNNEKCANQASGMSSNTGVLPTPAPLSPIDWNVGIETKDNFEIFGAYPNPAQDEVTLQIFMNKAEELKISVFSIDGKLVFTDTFSNTHIGSNYAQLNISSLAQGRYNIVVASNNNIVTKSIIKK